MVPSTKCSAPTRASAPQSAPPPRAAPRLLDERSLVVERDGSDVLLVHDASAELVGAIAAEHGVPLLELRSHTRSLEDAFLTLTGSNR